MLTLLDPIPDSVAAAIADGIAQSNERHAITRENFALTHTQHDTLIGGITASVSFGVLFINNIWVREPSRGTGIGRNLMLAAETEGRMRGAGIACVDTLSTQAPGFYTALGYGEFARITGQIETGPLERIWFRKSL